MSELCRPRVEGVRVSGSPWGTVWTLECEHFTAVGEWADLVALANAHMTASRQAYVRRLLGTLNTERRVPSRQAPRLTRRGGPLVPRGYVAAVPRPHPPVRATTRPTTASVLRELLELVASELIYRAAVARDDFDAATDRISRHIRGDR